MTATFKCFEAVTGGRIDREKGVISGVSCVTIGEAKGHETWIDRKTLETVQQVASEFSTGVKVKFRHGKRGEFQNVVDESCGILKNFRVDGKQVRADLHVLKSLEAGTKDKLFEMAEVMPDQFGLSIVFSGVNETIDGKKYLRCQELQSIDLTDKPAANPDGLFSMKTIKYASGDSGKHASDCMCDSCEGKGKSKSMEELSNAIASLTATVTGLVTRMDSAPAAAALSYKDSKGATVQLSAQDLVTKLEQANQFAADAKKASETSERTAVIAKLQAEGRVIFKDDGVAYKLEELQALNIALLKFAAKNSTVIPLTARATFTSTGALPSPNVLKDAAGKALTGEAETAAQWEANGYGSLAQMLASKN